MHEPKDVWDHALTSYNDNWTVWKRFYHDAWRIARQIAAGSPYSPVRVAYAIAALSPNMGWAQNVALARRAVELLAAAKPTDADQAMTALDPLGAMTSRKIAVSKALLIGDLPTGPKVSAFARNIAGDLSVVTVDRHMLDIFDGDRDACVRWCETMAEVSHLWPAEVQAVLWGAWRDTKGYATYNILEEEL